MFLEIKRIIDRELAKFIRDIDRGYSLSAISPLLFNSIKKFALREGNRIRPILFCVGYLSFTKRPAANIYTCALSFELLHDFMLIHDDIIDKSETRRGGPSMHNMLNRYLGGKKSVKFSGEDLAVVAGDVIYALGIQAFLSVKEEPVRKEKALKKFIDAAIHTGCGEFIELLYSIKELDEIRRQDIYKIYDLKTAYYSFATPLVTGATLAGAGQGMVKRLFDYGIYLGRAFQIKDDIIGIFSEEKDIGKSILTDLKESKKTLLIWHAYNNSSGKNRLAIKRIFEKEDIGRADLLIMRRIITESGSLRQARQEISNLLMKSEQLAASLAIPAKFKEFLRDYPRKILKL